MKTSRWKLPSCLLATTVLVAIMAGCNGVPRATSNPPVSAVTTPVALGQERSLDPSLLKEPTEPFKLGPGDRIEIEVMGDVASRSRVLVGPDGKIYFYVLPGLDVWGRSLPEVQAMIANELQAFVREKQPVAVTLRAVESQRVWVLGRLATPGIYPLAGPTTLLEAISLAGGPVSASSFTSMSAGRAGGGIGLPGATDEAADLSRSFVIRKGQLLPVDFNRLLRQGDLSQNIYLQSDDFIYLPSASAQEVHVLGAVTQSRTVNFVNQLTLLQAIANAGGTVKDAYVSHVAIVRGSLTDPQISVIDYEAVRKGRARDILLEPHDIIYVPYTPYRTVQRYANLILETFVRAVGVNEGARAIERDTDAASVTVPVTQ
jgi:protein involved in polysaccharide export with SLBB domain